MMRIAIGSERPPKIQAVQRAVQIIGTRLFPSPKSIEYLPRMVESGVSELPLSLEELMQGAFGRVQNLIRQLESEGTKADFYVGLEGGFFQMLDLQTKQTLTFLQGWVYVFNGRKGAFGCTSGIPVPPELARMAYAERLPAEKINAYLDSQSGERDIRSRQGAFGLFSRGLFTRDESFVHALLCAFAPFYNPNLYASLPQVNLGEKTPWICGG